MRIAYRSLDEMNGELAARIARRHGLEPVVLDREDILPAEDCDAVVFDLDHLAPGRLRATLDVLLAAPLRLPTAVHGYGLDDGVSRALRRRGVVVRRRLSPRLLLGLATKTTQA